MRIHQYGILCAPIVSQEAACEALKNGRGAMLEMRDQYQARRNYLSRSLRNLGLPCPTPDGAFYLFVNCAGTGLSSHEFAIRLLKQEKVAVVPGTAFGKTGEGFVRCCYATSMEQLETAVERIERFMKTVR